MPFGAFRGLLDIADVAAVAETARPAELLRAAHDSLTGDGGDLLFVVDDAHHLDHLSATLVYQLALSASARLVVTVRADTELPDAVAALSADELLTVVEVEPLDQAATAALLESALGAPLDAAASDEVFRRSQGNPLLPAAPSRRAGRVATKASTPALPALIDGYLAGLAHAGTRGAGLPGGGGAAAAAATWRRWPASMPSTKRKPPARSLPTTTRWCARPIPSTPTASAPRWHRTPRGRCAHRWSNGWRLGHPITSATSCDCPR